MAAVNPSLHIMAGARLLRASKLGQRNQRKNGEQGGNGGLSWQKKASGEWQEKTSEKGANRRVGEALRGHGEAKMTVGENKKRKEVQEPCMVNLGDKSGERLGRESEKGTLMKREPKGSILPSFLGNNAYTPCTMEFRWRLAM